MLELTGTYDLTMCSATGMSEAFDEYARTEPASVELPRLKVLLIEDNAARSKRTERALAHMSLFESQVTTAGTSAAARFALQADEFDVVLIDDSRRDDVAAALARSLDGWPVLAIDSGSLTAKSLQRAIHQEITEFAHRCSHVGG